ncbi:MAG: hypothetical protein RRY36_09635 [Bacteroidaceae bacterium]
MTSILQNSMGHLYGTGIELQTEGMFPAWLDQRGSRIMGGLIRLDGTIGTHKIYDIYADDYIRTGTMCSIGDKKELTPIPTYRILSAIDSTATKVIIANWFGLAKLIDGLKISNPDDETKSITINTNTTNGNTKINADGNYEVTITAGQLGTILGDALIAEDARVLDPFGLTKNNLDSRGVKNKIGHSFNVTLIDEGRILEYMVASVPTSYKRNYLQTLKFEK